MELGMVGLGRMGANMVRRLMRAGHRCVVQDASPAAVAAMAAEGAVAAEGLAGLVAALAPPRAIWLMLPAAITGRVAREIAGLLAPGDMLIDGGNSHYRDALALSAELAARGIAFVDVGTSGGVWGLERGYSLMIGGPVPAVRHLDPIFAALAPGADGRGAVPGAAETAPLGYLHCGPAGAGHFAKMVHNGIEYGLMAAYAEGLNILAHANAGARDAVADAETTPLPHPEEYRYDFDLARLTEVWRHGSVVSSWLLDLTAQALAGDAALGGYAGRVSDSGEGRWTLQAAIDTGTPAPVLAAALFQRFDSRGETEFANRVLSAMRHAFGGHLEKR